MFKRSLIFIHRWLGIALCVLFLLWFPSGIGMMYFPMPSVTAASRLERQPVLDPSRVMVSPREAADKVGVDAEDLRLTSFDGRPAYRPDGGRGGGGPVLYADTGEEQGEVSDEMVKRVASAWTGQPVSLASVEEVTEVDQWTLQTRLGDLSPVFKYSWPDGEQVYVSQATGEVVQYTTTASRIGAYLGPIPHWFYFTPLRKHGPEWSRVVIWSSGIGTISAILGVVIGLWMYSPSRRYRYAGAPTSIPYRGQKRWHTIFGLVFGVATVTYAFSGMLSMDPFPSFNDRVQQRRGGGEPNILRALRGETDLAAFDAKHPRQALEQLRGLPVKELELTTFAGEAIYLARLADGDTRIVPMRGEPRTGFDQDEIIRVVSAAAGGRLTTRVLDQYDRYYLDRTRRQPLPVVLAQSTSGSQTRYYIDPKTARVVQTYNSSNWVNRWLYNGLHSLNFPWLYNYRPLWDIVVIALMLGGTALCVTSLVLAWRVLGRKLARVLNARNTGEGALTEDLA
jgi:PepSY-associated transmembrane protein